MNTPLGIYAWPSLACDDIRQGPRLVLADIMTVQQSGSLVSPHAIDGFVFPAISRLRFALALILGALASVSLASLEASAQALRA